MAERVIVVGSRRGMERVPVSELTQMIGRAGRTHGVEVCHADVIIDSKDFSDVVSLMEKGGKVEVVSSLNSSRDVAFHILPQVCDGDGVSILDLEKWSSRTFMAFKGGCVDIHSAISLLQECGSVIIEGDRVLPTIMGRIAAKFYFHAEDVKAWFDNFTELFDLGLENEDVGAAWALGNVPVGRGVGDFSDRWEIVGECRSLIPESLVVRDGSLINVVLWWCAMGGASAGKMRHKVVAMKSDYSRIDRVLSELDDMANWGKEDFFEGLSVRVRRGIPMHLFELCRMGMSKSMAVYLYNMGVRDLNSLRNCMETMYLDIDDRGMMLLEGIANDAV